MMVSWYIFVATGTLWPARKMTAERGSPKGKCLVQCQRKSFASFLLCHAFTLFSHMWQPAYLDKKHLPFTNQINQPPQLDQLKTIRSSVTSMVMA